jgi:hypothetical protein
MISAELATLDTTGSALVAWDAALPELHRRLTDWRAMLSDDTPIARRMLRTLLTGRLVFTPRPKADAVEFVGRGDLGRLFTGLWICRGMSFH